MVAMGRKNQALLVGPWQHNNFDPGCGSVYFGTQDGVVRNYDDYVQLELRWFDRWLKGDTTADIGKSASYFVMGGGDGLRVNGKFNHGGHWEYRDVWPPPESRPTEFFLQAGGKLSTTKASEADSRTSYTYDPRNTVSSNSRCFINYPALQALGGIGPHDQIELATLPGHGTPGMPIASRGDVLVFQTETLAEEVTIAGDVRLVLHVSSDAPDTDFFVRLIDVCPANADYPAGFAMPLTDGVLRVRYRNSFSSPALMKPGEVYRLEIPLEPTANRFMPGHRIRVVITSSNFPAFDINRNTGDPMDRRWRIANNTVYHDVARPSSIVLPVCAAKK
jgi:putative CocE/NonD family hydrolase